MKIYVEWQDQFFKWKRYGYYHSDISAYNIARSRAKSTGKRYRLISEDRSLLDIIEPN